MASKNKFRALHNISFGTDRKHVKAGEVFELEDENLAEMLVKNGAATADLGVKTDPATASGLAAGEEASDKPEGEAEAEEEGEGDDEGKKKGRGHSRSAR
jgi:ribosomal protein L12E/L44/L45/RPP1/RPP2